MEIQNHTPLLYDRPLDFASETSGAFIVKLGGALISHKDEYCKPNMSIIKEFGATIGSRWDELQGRLVIVLGGGSYGNGVPHRYNLVASSQDWKSKELSIMTIKMFELMSLVTEIFGQEGLPCYPFQTSSYLMGGNGSPRSFFIEPIKHSLSMGLLPILSGDLVFDSGRGFSIFSSDAIPELFVGSLPLKRVVMLTNVPGVMNYSCGEPEIISRVTSENRNAVLRHAAASQQQDVSGGMKNKVKALLRIAELGIESVICDGRKPASIMRALFDSPPPGTVIEPRAMNHK
jgi:isopentenyl phosphate kinase